VLLFHMPAAVAIGLLPCHAMRSLSSTVPTQFDLQTSLSCDIDQLILWSTFG